MLQRQQMHISHECFKKVGDNPCGFGTHAGNLVMPIQILTQKTFQLAVLFQYSWTEPCQLRRIF